MREGTGRTGEDKGMCVLLPSAVFSIQHKAKEFLALLSQLIKPKCSLLVLIYFWFHKNILSKWRGKEENTFPLLKILSWSVISYCNIGIHIYAYTDTEAVE